jgi:hypothetical protein
MPRPDPPTRKRLRHLSGSALPFPGGYRFLDTLPRKRGRKGRDRDEGGVPVEPNRPNTLSGGATAALDSEGE